MPRATPILSSSQRQSMRTPIAVREFAQDITFPVLMDPDHLLTELYAISNVPTVVMIDENDRIVHPNWRCVRDRFVPASSPVLTPTSSMIGSGPGCVTTRPTDRRRDSRVRWRPQRPTRSRPGFGFGSRTSCVTATTSPARARNYAIAEGPSAPHDWTIRRAAMPRRARIPSVRTSCGSTRKPRRLVGRITA